MSNSEGATDTWQDHILVALSTGRTEKAAEILDEQLRTNQDLAREFPDLAGNWASQPGLTSEIWTLFAGNIATYVRHPNPLHFVAQVFLSIGQTDGAVVLYKRALKLGIAPAQVDEILARTGQQTNDTGAVMRWFDERIEAETGAGRAALLNHASRFYLASGRVVRAIKAFEELAGLIGPSPEISFNLGSAQELAGRYEEAIQSFEQAEALGFEGPQALFSKARLQARLHRVEEAVETVSLCIEAHPDFIGALLEKASWLERLNRLEEADAAATQALDRAPGHIGMQVLKVRLARRLKQDPAETLATTRTLVTSDAFLAADPGSRKHGYFELAEQCDRAGLYKDAWDAWSNGNKAANMAPDALAINEDTYPALVRGKQALLSQITPDMLPDAQDKNRKLAFFVGFPRSGTTLMEQILDSHPDIRTLDEKPLLAAIFNRLEKPEDLLSLTDEQRSALQSFYFEQAGIDPDSSEHGLLVDKLPLNLVNLDVIRFVFPGAPVIMALRDPRDCCLSNFAQNFVINDAMKHFVAPTSTAMLYNQVMSFYQDAETVLKPHLLRYRYEDLVADREPVLREIVEFVGLDWSDAILDHKATATAKFISTPSYEKVQSDINASAVARWKHYWKWLKKPFAPLDPWIDTFGYKQN